MVKTRVKAKKTKTVRTKAKARRAPASPLTEERDVLKERVRILEEEKLNIEQELEETKEQQRRTSAHEDVPSLPSTQVAPLARLDEALNALKEAKVNDEHFCPDTLIPFLEAIKADVARMDQQDKLAGTWRLHFNTPTPHGVHLKTTQCSICIALRDFR